MEYVVWIVMLVSIGGTYGNIPINEPVIRHERMWVYSTERVCRFELEGIETIFDGFTMEYDCVRFQVSKGG